MRKPGEQIEILLAEDNADDAQLCMIALADNHLINSVIHLKDGAQVLDYLFREGAYAGQPINYCPKIILLDLKMPKINGQDVLRRIKSDDNTKKIPVIVFTSSAEDVDVKECYQLGVNSYVVKPLQFDQYKSAINEIGLYWAILNHPCE
jgi:two-component system, response regulator